MLDSAAPASRWQLKPIAVTGCPGPVLLDAARSLGRATTNEVVLPESDYPQVSGHHARIVLRPDGPPELVDLGSRNGTFVNDRRIDRAVLRDGDLLQLGPEGPRFVVEGPRNGAMTALIPPHAGHARDLTQTALVKVKRALGVPENADVGELVASSERRTRRRLLRVAAAILVVGAGAVLAVRLLQRDDLRRLATLNDQLQEQIAGAGAAFEQQRSIWERQKLVLERERAAQQQRLQELSTREQTSQQDLSGLRQSLLETNERLTRYDPVNVERLRLQEVGRVQRAVVFVETKVRLRSSRTQKLLRVHGDRSDSTVTFADDDAVFERESSGSGFCAGADGSIVTNAHVVRPNGHDTEIELGPDERLQPEVTHAVVFSGSDQRHPATIVKVLAGEDADLALLRIEPFADMPHLENFDFAAAPPPIGAEVYLHGFPLGKMALQDGDRVIASSFRGILSRRVSNWLQVDAAVHPGNSGGPLTDAAGRVIGVVTRVQRIADEMIAPDMGYAIPIAAASRLWQSEPDAQPK